VSFEYRADLSTGSWRLRKAVTPSWPSSSDDLIHRPHPEAPFA
jgi:hypothetical protein